MTLDKCNAVPQKHQSALRRSPEKEAPDSPFALPVNLMLREGYVLVVDLHTNVQRHLAQILISRPLQVFVVIVGDANRG